MKKFDICFGRQSKEMTVIVSVEASTAAAAEIKAKAEAKRLGITSTIYWVREVNTLEAEF